MHGEREYQTYEGSLLGTNKFALTDAEGNFLSKDQRIRGARVPRIVFRIGGAQVQNRSGGAAVVGVGAHLDPTHWQAGQWVNATTTYTDDTVDAQDPGASDFALETTTVNDGHIVASYDPFNCIAYNVGTDSASATSTVREIAYSAADGAWTVLAAVGLYVGPPTAAAWATGERVLLFAKPPDWVPMSALHGTGVPIGMYGVRVRATTAPTTTAGAATRIVLGDIRLLQENVGDNTVWDFDLGGEVRVAGAHLAFVVTRDTSAANVANEDGSHATILAQPMG